MPRKLLPVNEIGEKFFSCSAENLPAVLQVRLLLVRKLLRVRSLGPGGSAAEV